MEFAPPPPIKSHTSTQGFSSSSLLLSISALARLRTNVSKSEASLPQAPSEKTGLLSPAEAERIRKCRGLVFALQDEPEVSRLWLPINDSPGLAMARAFGDFSLEDFWLISVPEISYRRLTEGDEFVVLATDGIWDVLSNKEVVDIVASAPALCSAARALVESAVRAWRFKYPTSKVDDCAVVCLFVHSKASDVCMASNAQTIEDPISMEPVD